MFNLSECMLCSAREDSQYIAILMEPSLIRKNTAYDQFVLTLSLTVAEWMPLPAEETDICDCPPGLEYLTHIDQLLVNQMIPTFESKCALEV